MASRLSYEAPRLRESPKSKEKQAGRGAGEAALELDRRKIRDRIAELRRELTAVVREQDVRRKHRSGARRVALVGYTNAGKSSLRRARKASSTSGALRSTTLTPSSSYFSDTTRPCSCISDTRRCSE